MFIIDTILVQTMLFGIGIYINEDYIKCLDEHLSKHMFVNV